MRRRREEEKFPAREVRLSWIEKTGVDRRLNARTMNDCSATTTTRSAARCSASAAAAAYDDDNDDNVAADADEVAVSPVEADASYREKGFESQFVRFQ